MCVLLDGGVREFLTFDILLQFKILPNLTDYLINHRLRIAVKLVFFFLNNCPVSNLFRVCLNWIIYLLNYQVLFVYKFFYNVLCKNFQPLYSFIYVCVNRTKAFESSLIIKIIVRIRGLSASIRDLATALNISLPQGYNEEVV
jgi:hypothetical protein